MFLLAFDVKAKLQRNHSSNVIPLGSWLSPIANRTSWLSPSGLFAFGFYPQGRKGFAIGIWLHTQPKNTIVWTANPDNPPLSSNATLNLTSDGMLLLRTEQGEENFTANFLDDPEPADSASMHDSGNFVLYDNSSNVVWQSFSNPTDTILGGQNLSSNDQLMSRSNHSSRRFRLWMDTRGNLVSYPVNSTDGPENAYWSVYTFAGSIVSLSLNQRGLLRLIDYSSTLIILANESYPGKKETRIVYRAILDSDGIFKLYSHHFWGNSYTSSNVSLEWSAVHDQCEVNGFCGLNSYCIGTGYKAECRCYPGYHFMDPKNKLLGCFNNFSEDGCSKGPVIPYDITAMRNISWGDFPYSVVSTKQENCYKSCLGDCNCGAAFYLYKNGTCNKYKLPLRYGRITNIPVIAFFKVIPANRPPNPVILMDSKKKIILILSVTLGSIAVLWSVIALSCFFIYRHQVHRYRKLSPENVNVEFAENFTLRSFSYNELENATNGFKEKLGGGSFGSVYKGRSIDVNVLTADEILLSNWVYNCLVAGQLDKLVEDENVDIRTLERMVKVGLWCIQEDPTLRPPMKNVILMLEGTMDIAVPPSPAISHS
ncbi:hypothetical protein CMV_015717 [Castanea mollissima]|uniref:Bulb-type lectin domain-containing protein n=1 Tax=Castanea mollissima TaxID=60419 RepID=A0A8J4QV50_9ROSI|nr:hypothetical protein CMV_015717 [Castanea mollissima]